MGRLKAGGAGPGGGGAEGLQRAGGSWITSLMTVKVSRPLAFICVLLAVMQLSGAAQSAGAMEGEGRYLATPLAPVRPATPLPGPPNSPVATYAMEKPSGNYIPNLPYLRPHLDEAPNTLLRNNHSHQDNHRLPLQPIHHHSNHHNHHHSHHEPHHHHWEIEGATVYEEEEEDEEDEGEEDEERIETVKNVNGEGIFGRFSISSPHHHHKHHRQKQPPQPTMKRRSATSPARDEAGGYAFRVDEKSGVRRVIAVREAAGWGGEGGDPRSRNSLLDRPQDDATVGPPPGPSFDRNLPRNITIQAGKTAVLSCRVFNVNDKSVSWIRQDNLHILTVDKYKYSTDQRVSVLFNEPNLEWVLRIKSVTPADAGTYECQVSTKPILSFVVNMRVVVPQAWILNAPEIYVHRGSPINLTCVVTHGTERPVFIYWYHHDKVIDYEGRGGVRVHTQTGRDTVSHLLVKEAGPGDTGRYTCSPSNGEPATVMLHVLNGEHQAAMQTNRGTTLLVGPGGDLGVLLLSLSLLHGLQRLQIKRL
ncbi:uncharacterized protein LOC127001843 isoform X2 [Eriocheir sinensis]|uniref:uncharacterized protein LOC127001843 isoform X2 n=1 Tax=Eriocheir sinensis TaxID=95602 RepID=UPI0021C67833|nr:uncharacterized protein LOC127001843 isoform X2 [Eriocheir sinensis]